MRLARLITHLAKWATRAGAWVEGHPVQCWVVAFLMVLLPTAWETSHWVQADYPQATWHHTPPGIEVEVVHAAAAKAGWKELWSYWTGRIIHGNDYYQPLTSWLFVGEERLWHGDNRAWTVLNVLLHPICVLLLAWTTAYLLRGPLPRRLAGFLLTGWLFGAPGLADQAAQSWIVCWWPVQPDLFALIFSLLLLLCTAAYVRSGDWRFIPAALLCFFLGVCFKETAYTAGVGACLLLVRHRRRWPMLGAVALTGIVFFLIRWRALAGVLAFGAGNQPHRTWPRLLLELRLLLPPSLETSALCLFLVALGWFLPTLLRRGNWGWGLRALTSVGTLLGIGGLIIGPPWDLAFQQAVLPLLVSAWYLALILGLVCLMRGWPWPELFLIFAMNCYLAWSFTATLGWHAYWSDAFGCMLTAAIVIHLLQWAGARLRHSAERSPEISATFAG